MDDPAARVPATAVATSDNLFSRELASRILLIQDVIAAVAGASSLEEVGAIITERGLTALGAYAGSIALVADDRASCRIAYASGYEPRLLAAWRSIPLDAPVPIAEAVRTTAPVWLPDREAYAARYPQLIAGQAPESTQALAVLPLLIGSTATGAIGLSFTTPQTFPEADRAFMLALARQVAQVIEHARLRTAEQVLRATLESRVRQQAAIARLGGLALASTRRDPFLQAACELITDTLDVPLCKVLELLPDDAGLLLRAGVGWRPGMVGQAIVGSGSDTQADYTLQSSAPVVVADLATDTRFAGSPLLHGHGVVSGMSVIIGSDPRPYGVLSVHTREPRDFTGDDVAFLQAVSSILATALQRLQTDAERGRLLGQVERERRLLSSVIEQMPAGIVIVEAPSGRIVQANEGLARIWRHPIWYAEDIGQYRLYRGFHADGRPYEPHEWPAARSIATGEVVIAEEVQILRGDDAPGTLEISSVPIRDAEGRIIAGVVVTIDITERKAREAEHLALERRLQDTQRLESLGVLAGGIAHDFNNLLAIMLGNANLALMELPPESPARESIEQIERAGQRAAELTRQMLAYAGKGRFVVLPLNLNTLIAEIDHLLQASISKRVVLRYHMAAELPAVEADATQIRQVIMNLVVNASEAIGELSGVITIATRAQWVDRAYLEEAHLGSDLPDGMYVSLEVSDTGIGMDASTQARIFEPFFTTKFTGRGLGLAAVQGIIRRHRGSLRVYSEPGHGSIFKLLLPAVDAPVTESPATVGEEVAWRGEGTVLIVDDDPDVRGLLGRIVRQLGFEVREAPDGRAGVEAYQAVAAEVVAVLLDMTMPHMGGEEAFRALRRIRPDVPVILMSGYSEEDITGRFAGKGLAGFLHKPFAPSSVRAKLQDVLGDRRGS